MQKGKKVSGKRGLPPGTIVHIGEKKAENTRIKIIDYDSKNFQEKEAKKIEECFPFKDKPTVTWINVDGLHNVEILEKIGNKFDVHSLVLEDIVNTTQRPKMEDLESYLFIVLKMMDYNEKAKEIISEQVSFILGPNFVISFQEREGDIFDTLRDRIRNNKGRIRKIGADYLAYSLIDTLVDNYFMILEKTGETIETLEDSVILDPSPKTLQKIQKLKKEMILLRKSVWPLRELINGLQKSESKLIKKSTGVYLRDVYDHTIQVIDTVETYRDLLSGMHDTYLSSISNRMNDVMKVLTISASIFIPLTFIAGIYGMNFNSEASFFNMPELNWEWGYVMVWAVMISVVAIMLIYFKRKKWL